MAAQFFERFRIQQVVEEEVSEATTSVPTAKVDIVEDDDATALLRYMKKQGKLSLQETATNLIDDDDNNHIDTINNKKTNKVKRLPAGAAEEEDDEDEDEDEKDKDKKKEEKSEEKTDEQKAEDEIKRKKKEEEDEKNMLLKYMSQRGVVMRPAVAQAVAIPSGDTPDSSTKSVEGRFQLGLGVDQVPTAELLREVRLYTVYIKITIYLFEHHSYIYIYIVIGS